MTDITEIIIAVIGLLSAIITAFWIPYIKTKTTSQRWTYLREISDVAVLAAEQLGATRIIQDKLTYAEAQVKTELEKNNLKYDDDAIRAAIEAAVKQNFGKK